MKRDRLGFAFGIGLRKEAKVVWNLMSNLGFVVIPALLSGLIQTFQTGSKGKIDVRDDQKISPCNFETMRNPVMQVSILNDEKTDFNFLLGLYV